MSTRLKSTSAVVLAIGFISLFPCNSRAEDGAGLFKAKCAPCHGKDARGKASMKAPSLLAQEARNMTDDEIKNFIVMRANGEHEKDSSHTMLKQHLSADQLNALVAYLRNLH